MATMFNFDIDEIAKPTSDAGLNQRSVTLVEKVRALYLESYNLQEAKKPILLADLEVQHEALKDQLREKKKAIKNISDAKDKFTSRLMSASNVLETAQMKLRNVIDAAPKDDDYPSRAEIAAYNKRLAAAQTEVVKAEEVHAKLVPYVRYWDNELEKLRDEFNILAKQEIGLRQILKPVDGNVLALNSPTSLQSEVSLTLEEMQARNMMVRTKS